MQASDSDKKLIRYLLGDVSEVERTDIENRYWSQEGSFDELLVAEDELIDDYVRGELSRKDQELFEQQFLCTPARQERVKSSRALMKFADTHAAASGSAWQPLRLMFRLESAALRIVLAAGFMMLLIGGPLLVIQMSKLRSDLKGLQSEQLAQNQREKELEQLLAQQKQRNDELDQSINRERSERGQLEQEVARLREQQAPPPTIELGLGEIEKGKGSTSTQPAKITVPRGTDVLKLQLDLFKDEYENYLVVLEDAKHQDIWRGSLQSARAGKGRAVVVRLASRLFSSGQYKLTLSGTNNNKDYEVISEFPVDVIKK